ncbi:hypothetical protein RJT34_07965 [Clitoria ternatea]|uniref:Uncharacterized protein n=1 Tax=Clitoria ternatea TaxID=43366 RepID=A0AAN9K743_CLITE
MGKKKPQKTKELSVVAIAEASETGKQQPQAPRKRGRPRKIIVKMEKSEEEEEKEGPEKGTTNNEEEEAPSSPCIIRNIAKQQDMQIPPKGSEQPSRSRARRKSKPRKST